MALIVEDGTIVAGADSYVTLAYASDYHEKRGNTGWATLDSAEQEQAIRRATDYLGQAYRLRWKGSRVSTEQALDWPRNYVERDDFQPSQLNGYSVIGGIAYYPNNIVPDEVKKACAEAAFRAGQGELIPDLTQLVTREKIDTIEIEYSEYSNQLPRYKAIDYLLAPFLQGNSNSMKVIRT